MRISDWSSDVCSSDLGRAAVAGERRVHGSNERAGNLVVPAAGDRRRPRHGILEDVEEEAVEGIVRQKRRVVIEAAPRRCEGAFERTHIMHAITFQAAPKRYCACWIIGVHPGWRRLSPYD